MKRRAKSISRLLRVRGPGGSTGWSSRLVASKSWQDAALPLGRLVHMAATVVSQGNSSDYAPNKVHHVRGQSF